MMTSMRCVKISELIAGKLGEASVVIIHIVRLGWRPASVLPSWIRYVRMCGWQWCWMCSASECRRTWTSGFPPGFFNVWWMLILSWWIFAPYPKTDHSLSMAVRRVLIKSFDWCSMLRCRPYVVRTAVINHECHDLMSVHQYANELPNVRDNRKSRVNQEHNDWHDCHDLVW